MTCQVDLVEQCAQVLWCVTCGLVLECLMSHRVEEMSHRVAEMSDVVAEMSHLVEEMSHLVEEMCSNDLLR